MSKGEIYVFWNQFIISNLKWNILITCRPKEPIKANKQGHTVRVMDYLLTLWPDLLNISFHAVS